MLLEKFQLNLKEATPDDEEALMEIQNRHSIIIKPADKGSTIVIVDKEDYAFEAMRQLQDKEFYKPLQEPIYLETQNQIVQLLKQLHKTKHINHKQLLFLTGTNLPRPRYFYLLPKIHKETAEWTKPTQIPKGRPIVSDCSSESYGSAHLINHYLNPLSNKHPSYIRDTNDFLQKVNTHNITELIHYGCGKLIYKQLEAVRKYLQENPDPARPDDVILELLKSNQERNDFQFDDKWFLQIKGTAMGKTFSPAYANIYMAKWEKEGFLKCNKLPEAYYRYLDDIWGVWNHSREDLDHFIKTLNNHQRHKH